MSKIVCVLYEDPVDGYPTSYPRDGLPVLAEYPGGQTLPTPEGNRLRSRTNSSGASLARSGLRKFLEGLGHTLVVTSDKDGEDSVFDRELPDAEVVISQPFWPAYLTAERIAKAPNLKLAITAGIGSDHVDLQAAIDKGVTVAEVTYCNSISVAEHVVMMILVARPQLHPLVPVGRATAGGTSPTACERSYDVEGMVVGTVAAGRIGFAVLSDWRPSMWSCTTPTGTACRNRSRKSSGFTYHPDTQSTREGL